MRPLVRIQRPSGLKDAVLTGQVAAKHVQQVACGDAPDARVTVLACRRDELPVRTEFGVVHCLAVSAKEVQQRSGIDGPDPRHLVSARRHEEATVRTERDTDDRAAVPLYVQQPSVDAPDPRGLVTVVSCRSDTPSVWAERDIQQGVFVAVQNVEKLSVDCSPDTRVAVGPGRRQKPSVRAENCPHHRRRMREQPEQSAVRDNLREDNESLQVTLSNPVNASIAKGSATGTIQNDDTAVAVTAGSYKGATQNGNFVFFTVTPSRTVTSFRINDLPDPCEPYGTLPGGEDFGNSAFTIRDDESFAAQGSYDNPNPSGDTLTHWDGRITGQFSSATSVSGTVLMNYELNYQGTHFKCSSGTVTWTASLQ
jgi:hypothetical protein